MISISGDDFLLRVKWRTIQDLVLSHQGAFDRSHGSAIAGAATETDTAAPAARTPESKFEFQAGRGRSCGEGVRRVVGRIGRDDGFDLQLGRIRSFPSFPMLVFVLLVAFLFVSVFVVLVMLLASITFMSLFALMSFRRLRFDSPGSGGGGGGRGGGTIGMLNERTG